VDLYIHSPIRLLLQYKMNAKMTLQNSLRLLPPTCFLFHTTRRARDFSLLHKAQIDSGASPASYSVGTGDSWVKRQVRKADHSPPTTAEVMKGGAIHVLLHISSSRGT
jgi:hypothetical protein